MPLSDASRNYSSDLIRHEECVYRWKSHGLVQGPVVNGKRQTLSEHIVQEDEIAVDGCKSRIGRRRGVDLSKLIVAKVLQ